MDRLGYLDSEEFCKTIDWYDGAKITEPATCSLIYRRNQVLV